MILSDKIQNCMKSKILLKSLFSHFFVCSVLFCVAVFPACSKQASKSESFESLESFSIQEVVNPEFSRFDCVFEKMSERCKSAMSISPAMSVSEKEQFLSDLHSVLDSERNFSSDDLSPFFLIDKKNSVSADYVPENLVHLEENALYAITKNSLNLRPEAFEALNVLSAAAKADGITLTVSSTYRSYDYQKNLFEYWVRVDGLEEAERESARPGTSQHQLGMALDFAPVDDKFAETEAGKWVYENAAKFGWSLSFPQGYEDVTGYRWESWHFRYIGVPAIQFQQKYFGDVQQFMIEFIDAWKNDL